MKPKRRLFYFILFLAALTIPLVIQLFNLAVLVPKDPDDGLTRLSTVQRGPILDRNGKILAIQTKQNSVSAWLPDISDIKETARLLALVLDMNEAQLLARMQKQPGFIWVKRKVTSTEAQKVQELMDAGSLKGIKLIPEMGRTYPKYNLASHILGYVGIDNVGLDGIEYALNSELYPEPERQNPEVVHGYQVVLSIDSNVQYTIEKIAAETREEHKAESVMVIVANAKTGELLGCCSTPDFNPNDYQKYSAADRNNRPAAMAYEPGSVLKVFTIASMLETGFLNEKETFTCNGYYEKSGYRIKCQGVHGEVNAQLILKYSCNAGAAYASDKIDKKTFFTMLTNFGFGESTGIGLPGETPGIFRRPSEWSERSKATIAFGQEISVSALQIIQAATALANDGVMLKPLLIKRIVTSDGKIVREYGRTPVRTILSSNTAHAVLLMMETATTSNGSARVAAVDGLRIAAKTGTSQILDRKTGKYSETDFIPSLLGIFPVNDPQIILYVAVVKPKGEQYLSSRIAAPLFKKVTENLLTVIDISSDKNTAIEHTGEIKVIKPESIKIGGTMPDLSGMPKRLLLPLFNRQDISFSITGEGYVVRQDPPPGTAITKGMKITLELK